MIAWIAALLLGGAAYETLGGWIDRHRFPPRGRILKAGSVWLHANEQGSGDPTVILESGIAASSLSWILVQPSIAKFTHAVSYDRAGLGWSSGCLEPRELHAMLDEFDALISAAALSPPFVLVGHSFGGLLMRAWTHRHPECVAGLVLVDPVSLEYWGKCSPIEMYRLSVGVSLARRGRFLSHFGVVRAALGALATGGKKFPVLIGRAAARAAMGTMEHLAGEIRKFPPEIWPIIRAHWSRAKCLSALSAYLDCLPRAAHEALTMPVPPDIPLIVLSAANATAEELSERDSWVRVSANGRHEIIPDTGHWIPFEQPEAVIAAVEDLVRKARRATLQ